MAETIWAMKLAVIPMMAISEQPWNARAMWKVAPRAPFDCMLVVGVEIES